MQKNTDFDFSDCVGDIRYSPKHHRTKHTRLAFAALARRGQRADR